MSQTPTPHNAAKPGDIAKKVLMPGDPLRAKFVAETYLENPVCFNTVRNVYGYTGKYKGKEVSVMASGMGMPSIGLYSYELFNFYDVDEIIRIGSAGSLLDDVHVREIVFAIGANTDSNFATQYDLHGTYAPTCSYSLLERAVEEAKKLNVKYHVGNVLSTDVFYSTDKTKALKWKEMGTIAIEMECAALYAVAAYAKKKALGILTISDHVFLGENTTAEERQNTFNKMMEIALEI